MLTLPSSIRILVSSGTTDLRKSFDGLSALVTSQFEHDPLDGNLYVFHNRRRNQVRVLFWDRTGFMIIGKKLARGTFHFLRSEGHDGPYIEMDSAELSLVMEGIDLTNAKKRLRWRPLNKAA